MRHKIIVYDQTGKNILAIFSPPLGPEQTSLFRFPKYDFRPGIANRSFEVLTSDKKSQYIKEGNWVEFWRLGVPVARGQIKPLTPSKDMLWLKVNAFGDGVQLHNHYTPPEWDWWNGWDLADIIRAMMWGMIWDSWSVQEQWEFCTLNSTQILGLVDSEHNSEDIILGVNANNAFLTTGEIVSNIVQREDAEEWYVLQVADSVSADTAIKYFVRSGNTATPDASWSVWTEMVRSPPTTKTWSVSGQAGKYLQWKAVLSTENTEDEGMEGTYGHSPVLHALRVVRRYRISGIKEGAIPVSFGLSAVDFKPGNEKYSEILEKLCKKYEVKYWFDCDWEDRTSRIHTSLSPGVDRSRQPGCIWREGRDFRKLDVQFDRNSYCNYLLLLGAGDGVNQLSDFVKDDVEIADRGRIVGKYEDSECKDIAVLRTKGLEELEKRKKGKYAIEVRMPGGRFKKQGQLPYGLYDTVQVVGKSQSIIATHQIIELCISETSRGETIAVKLDNQILTTNHILDNIRRKVYGDTYSPSNPLRPKPTVNVFARGEYGYISLSCYGEGEEFEWWVSKDGIEYKYLKTVKTHDTDHRQLAVGTQYWYKVRQRVGSYWSNLSGAATTIVKSIQPEDLDKMPPAKPAGLNVVKDVVISHDGVVLYRNKLSWDGVVTNADGTPINDLREYILERAELSGENPGPFWELTRISKGTLFYYDLLGLEKGKTYVYRMRADDIVGNPSEYSDHLQVTVDQTAEAPGGTITLHLVQKAGAIRVEITHDDRPADIGGWSVYAGATPDFVPTAANKKGEGFTLVHEFPAEVGKDYWVKVQAYSRSGIPGQFITAGPVQAKLLDHADLSMATYQSRISVAPELVSGDLKNISDDNPNTSVICQPNTTFLFEYPIIYTFDSIIIKATHVESTGTKASMVVIEYLDPGGTWKLVTQTTSKTIFGDPLLKQMVFAQMIQTRAIRIQVYHDYVQHTVSIIRPMTKNIADVGVFGTLSAGMLNVVSANGRFKIADGWIQYDAQGRKIRELDSQGNVYVYNPVSGQVTYIERNDGSLVMFGGATGQDEIFILGRDAQGNILSRFGGTLADGIVEANNLKVDQIEMKHIKKAIYTGEHTFDSMVLNIARSRTFGHQNMTYFCGSPYISFVDIDGYYWTLIDDQYITQNNDDGTWAKIRITVSSIFTDSFMVTLKYVEGNATQTKPVLLYVKRWGIYN